MEKKTNDENRLSPEDARALITIQQLAAKYRGTIAQHRVIQEAILYLERRLKDCFPSSRA